MKHILIGCLLASIALLGIAVHQEANAFLIILFSCMVSLSISLLLLHHGQQEVMQQRKLDAKLRRDELELWEEGIN
jgi:hypothetical protein